LGRRRHRGSSNQTTADDLLNKVLWLLDIDFRAFTGDETFWDRIREKSRKGKPVFDPSLSSPNNQLLISVEDIIKEQSGSTAEAGQLIRLIHSLGTIGTRSSEGNPTVNSVRPQFAHESYLATRAHETFREGYDARKLKQKQRRAAAKTAARLMAVLSVSVTIYGFSVDALSAGQVFEHLRRAASIVEHLDPGFTGDDRPQGPRPDGPGLPGKGMNPNLPGGPGAAAGGNEPGPQSRRYGGAAVLGGGDHAPGSSTSSDGDEAPGLPELPAPPRQDPPPRPGRGPAPAGP
jgi:hypothetical protein